MTDQPLKILVLSAFDGANANVLHDMAQRGEAPNVARLIEMGSAMGYGAMSSLPTSSAGTDVTP